MKNKMKKTPTIGTTFLHLRLRVTRRPGPQSYLGLIFFLSILKHDLPQHKDLRELS